MIMDVLGIVIAFCSIMLLFSLLVTSINQALQKTLHFRYRHLQLGMRELIEHLTTNIPTVPKEIINDSIETLINGSKISLAVRKKAAYISEEEILDSIDSTIKNHTDIVSKSALKQLQTEISDIFPKIEFLMQQRFQNFMELLSIAIALVICLCFQINTFDLLKELSNDTQKREEYITIAEKHIGIDEKTQTPSNETPSLYNFTFLPEGMHYFLGERKTQQTQENTSPINLLNFLFNWFGMAVSAVLISLGAPFWFNNLKTLFKIRDQLLFKPNG